MTTGRRSPQTTNMNLKVCKMYSIGQVLYVISNTSHTIEPVRVHSKQTNEDMAGKTVTHVCLTTDGENYKLEENSEYIGGIFDTIEEAEKHLMSLAAEMVKKLAVVAGEKAKVFEVNPKVSDKDTQEGANTTEETKDEKHTELVTLPDGTKAKLNFPVVS